ncbi:MAG: SDR family oxidoreductase [Sinobacterium sp.]|nr:SDR family oxidoreductase [Sinobacterium sp.]
MNPEGKIVAITGGAQGLGLSMAKVFAAKGAKLALIDLNEERLAEAVAICEKLGGEAKAFKANVADEADVEATFTAIVTELGGLDCLINNAGITRDGLLLKVKDGVVQKRMGLAEWQMVIDVNLTGVFLCGREAATKMAEAGTKGCIINISSISKEGNMGQSNYSAAKAGVAALTVTWAKELSRYGIRCGGIAPGFIATEMVMSMKPEALEKMAGMIPLKRLGEPEEIGLTAMYILENDYYTGRTIEMDGGMRL